MKPYVIAKRNNKKKGIIIWIREDKDKINPFCAFSPYPFLLWHFCSSTLAKEVLECFESKCPLGPSCSCSCWIQAVLNWGSESFTGGWNWGRNFPRRIPGFLGSLGGNFAWVTLSLLFYEGAQLDNSQKFCCVRAVSEQAPARCTDILAWRTCFLW